MTPEDLLGRKEGQQLEFKSRDALRARFKIGREVVAMLNADGGEIWIGLAEEAGRAVRVEPIEKPEVERRALRDFLVDTIEPPLSSEEIKIQTVMGEQDSSVLKIEVQPKENRQPYAFLRKSLRDYVLRIDERLRPMSREKIFEHVRKVTQSKDDRHKALADAITRVQKTREQVERFPKGTFWLYFEPVEELSIEVQDPIFEDMVLDPSLTGNRRPGWNFAQASEPPTLSGAKDRVVWREQTLDGLWFEVMAYHTGRLSFRATLRAFSWKGQETELWPYCLLEYPTSAFRLASFIYREWASTTPRVVVECALLNVSDWILRPGRPGYINFSRSRPRRYKEAQDLIWEKPLVFDMTEIQEEPDRCGFRLLRRIYEAFSYPESQIPFFDRDTGRLVLPE